eukprot:41729-Rhodomonas_salina.1
MRILPVSHQSVLFAVPEQVRHPGGIPRRIPWYRSLRYPGTLVHGYTGTILRTRGSGRGDKIDGQGVVNWHFPGDHRISETLPRHE